MLVYVGLGAITYSGFGGHIEPKKMALSCSSLLIRYD